MSAGTAAAGEVQIETAGTADAAMLATLFTESSGGVWPAVWRTRALDGESVSAAGARIIREGDSGVCLGNTVVAILAGERLGALCCYQERPGGAGAALPAALQSALRPYAALSDPQSWFVAELACLPSARGRGLGTRLLEHAAQQGRSHGLPRLSLRVFSENTGAVRLYRRFGFDVVGEQPVVAHADITARGSVYAMVKALA
ncbi:MAG: GNAT family N-acetyltransferase [Pseudomonadota bacterium]